MILLVACGIEVPPEKSAYVGDWEAEGMTLQINRDDRVSFKRFRKGASTKIEATVKGFHGDDFEIVIGPMTTTFQISSPPREIDGVWKMTVEAVELTRLIPAQCKACAEQEIADRAADQ